MVLLAWNQVISELTAPHILQTSQWADHKKISGWKAHFLAWHQAGPRLELRISRTGTFEDLDPLAAALVLERQVLPGLAVMYSPKGPLMSDWKDQSLREQVRSDLEGFAKRSRVIQLKIDPDLALGLGEPGEPGSCRDALGTVYQQELEKNGWLFSADQIQFRNTVLIDLRDDEELILERMKSKTRYNIRLSGRKGITVRAGDQKDLPGLYQMYANTSLRGDFTIRGEAYYLALWQSFLDRDQLPGSDPVAQPLIAEYQGQPVAGAVIFKFGERAWYLHGMSLPEHTEKMAPHLIQWEAIRWAKSQGCLVYDMWGAPDTFEESDSLWGVYRFKKGYGGKVLRTIGAWDYPARPLIYRLYTRWLPRLLNILRWFGDRRTRRIGAASTPGGISN